ncbi:MAG TPA: magnesium chelatase subunit D [Paracoccaceae bacterium]|nr:magnesium chelatase subunit D [Paracoccaceae bacterium]
MTDAPAPGWPRAAAALAVLAVDPGALGGLWLRGRAGPVRDALVAALAALPLPLRKLHPGVGDEVLYGGIDLPATLAAGRAVRSQGVLAEVPAILLTMAERCPGGLAVRLGQWLDGAPGGCVVALDEGAEDGELAPPALTDRLGLFLDCDGLSAAQARGLAPDPALVAAARERLPYVDTPRDAATALVMTAAALGIASLRAPLQALAVARAAAALRGADAVEEEDLKLAVELALAHRATIQPEAPAPEDDAPPPPPPPEAEGEDAQAPDPETLQLPEEILLEAARAALPADLLARLAAGRAARAAKGVSGTGAARKGNRRGRPLPSRAGHPDGQSRIDPVATLRAAAPWQAVRRAIQPGTDRLLIRPADFRLRRFQENSDRVLIFAVDASGSSALARLAEAKGAVELLLAQAYARRDHVALVAFRGAGAELLLPPTRSLVQTKRRLAGLPGGGGTPLAAGLRLAMEVAALTRGRGMTPTVALLTDGRANVALDGRGDRAAAMEDAARLARLLAATGVPAVVIDTATRPQAELRTLSARMGATYLALPRADAGRLSAALSAALGD